MVDSEVDEDDATSKLGSKQKFNFASYSAGAVVLDKSPNSAQGFSNLLDDDMDRYGISPCNEKKWVVIGLSEDILVSSVVIANYEKYSSTLKDFQLLASTSYPANEWINLGQYQATPALGEQAFEIPTTTFSPHTRYLKFRFLTHYGNEDLCTLSQIKVHGTTVIASFQQEVKRSDDIVKNMLSQLKTDDRTQYPNLPATSNDSAVSSQTIRENFISGTDSVIDSELSTNKADHPSDIAVVCNSNSTVTCVNEEDGHASEVFNSFEPLVEAREALLANSSSSLPRILHDQPSPAPHDESLLRPIYKPEVLPISKPSEISELIVNAEPSSEPTFPPNIVKKGSTSKQPELFFRENIVPISRDEFVQNDVNTTLSVEIIDTSVCNSEVNVSMPTGSGSDLADSSVVTLLGVSTSATVQTPVAQVTVTVTVSTNELPSKAAILSNNNNTASSPSNASTAVIDVTSNNTNGLVHQQQTQHTLPHAIGSQNIVCSINVEATNLSEVIALSNVPDYTLSSHDKSGQEVAVSLNTPTDAFGKCTNGIESATTNTANSTHKDATLLQCNEDAVDINSTLITYFIVNNTKSFESLNGITVNEVSNISTYSNTSFENIASINVQPSETSSDALSNVSVLEGIRPASSTCSLFTNTLSISSNVSSLSVQHNSTFTSTLPSATNNITIAPDSCTSISYLSNNNTMSSFANTTSSNTTSNGGSSIGPNCAFSSISTFNTAGGAKQLTSSCLDSLKFLEFKSKMEAKFTTPIREAGTDSSQENVFTQLMQKIKHLEMSHAIYELYAIQMSECHHVVLTELWNNRRATITSERLDNIEHVLTTLQTQQEYIDQLKLALELSSPSPTNSASLSIFDHPETELQTTLTERLVSLSSMPSSASIAMRPSTESTSTAVTAYPGRGLKNFADCRIFSSNSLALRDCYENVYVNLHVDVNSSHNLALELQFEGIDIKVLAGLQQSTHQSSSHNNPDVIETSIKVPIFTSLGNYHVNDTSATISSGGVGPIREESGARRKPRPKEEYIDHRGPIGTGFLYNEAALGWVKPEWLPLPKLHEQDVILLALGSAALSSVTLFTLLVVVLVSCCRQSRSNRHRETSKGIVNKHDLHEFDISTL